MTEQTASASASWRDAVLQFWFKPLDIAALAAYRVLFGLLMFCGTLRFMAQGWIDRLYVEPTFHFKYWGFEWVQVPDQAGLYALYTAIAVSALMVALGLFYRVAIISFWCLFTYAELMDVTTYLNHYYLVSLQALILCFLSPHRMWSVDAWLRPGIQTQTLPAWQTYWLRFQVGLLYFYAGLAKFETDWLLHAQPLNIWLPAHTGLPLLGPFLGQPWVHFAFSWFAFLFDTFIIAFMLWRRARPYAFVVILVFHLFTHLFFNIGLFPFIMVIGVLNYFEPDWPRRLMPWLSQTFTPVAAPASRWTPRRTALVAAVGTFCLFQFLMPLRHWLYPGTVLWHEQGMRFSWRVMLREKSGALDYRVVTRDGLSEIVSPYSYLTDQQYREMAAQPDMILFLAHRIRDDYNARGVGPVKVFADSVVSLNGRSGARLIDPAVDLAQVEDGLHVAAWITAPPTEPPPLMSRLRLSLADSAPSSD